MSELRARSTTHQDAGDNDGRRKERLLGESYRRQRQLMPIVTIEGGVTTMGASSSVKCSQWQRRSANTNINSAAMCVNYYCTR
jgi:hypothetical protein